MRLNNYPSMPSAAAERVKQTRLRRRMLEGVWSADLRARLVDTIDPERLRAWGPEDITKNNYRSIVHQLATLYDRVGSFTNPENEASGDTVDALLKGAGWWQLAIRHQRFVVGLRESLVRVSVLGEGDTASLQLRLVTPDLVEAYASMDTPDEPHTVIEYRVRQVTRGGRTREEWTRDYVSVQGEPVYRIESEDGTEDLTAQFRDGTGWPDRWRDSAGAPVLPFILYHAERTGKLFDPFEGVELVDGSLNIAALWTYWNHIVRSASHPQRLLFNAQPMGGVKTVEEEGGVRIGRVIEDPTSMLLMEATDSTKPATAYQFQPGGDPEAIGRAIRDFAAHLALDYGISPTDIDRTHGNAQSGYAVALSRDGVRQAQRRHEPEAARGDAQLARVVAVQWSRATGVQLAEDGYRPHYLGLEASIEEKRLELDRMTLEMDRGLLSPVDVYMRLHQVERATAIQELGRIRAESAQYRQMAG